MKKKERFFNWNCWIKIVSRIDLTSGSSQDWVYGVAKIPLSYTLEMRDKGNFQEVLELVLRRDDHYLFFLEGENGFILPANQIIPNSEEVLDGLIAMTKEATELNYL